MRMGPPEFRYLRRRSDESTMARSLVTVLFAALVLTGSSASPAATEQPTVQAKPIFFISGRGWGHGLGMSQYGAYGYAQHGWTYDRIIKHYYTGVTIGQAPVKRVRVLLADGVRSATIASKQALKVVDADGNPFVLDPGTYKVGTAFKAKDGTDPTAKPQPLTYPIEFRPGSAVLSLNGRAYRGSFRLLKSGSKLRVVNVVDLDLYLRGVVPSEMPKDWAPEALKAQAVAARSYALSHLHTGGGFDLYPDTRDQVYLGIPHEAPATTAAVNATDGQVALYKGKVASTYFFSTSGGRTANVQDLYPEAAPIPYLVSVVDKYDTISPYHEWGPYRFSARKLGRAFKSPGRLLDVQTVPSASGRVETVVATGANGESEIDGAAVRSKLGLRSTWFRVGVLALDPPTQPVAYGTAAALPGRARGVGSVELQQSGPDGWKTVAKLTPRGGNVQPKVRLKASCKFRLAVGDLATSPVAVAVVRSVRLHVPNDLTGFWGTVRPLAAGIKVQIQRQSGTAWRYVTSAKTTANGRFTVARNVAPGTYRVRIPAGEGFATTVSKPLAVS
jgi:stage II sporulation protein D